MLFVCKLNPVTQVVIEEGRYSSVISVDCREMKSENVNNMVLQEEDLEVIFSRFGKVVS